MSVSSLLDKKYSESGRQEKKNPRLTRIGDTNADVAAKEALLVQRKSLAQIVGGGELGVSKALGTALGTILDDADADNLAASAREEIIHSLLVGIVRQVAEVSSVGRLVGDGELLALLAGVTCWENLLKTASQVIC